MTAKGFTSPVALASWPDGSGRLLVVDQIGTISLVEKNGDVRAGLFLDMREKLTKLNNRAFDERGLLGLALHPQFKDNGKFYVCYSAPLRNKDLVDWDHTMRLSEFKILNQKEPAADPASERVVLEIDKPWFNHNGGCVAFGPDGYLYLSVGDGGNANDDGRGHAPQGNGQDLTTFMGKILRLDVNKGNPYAIPVDNPFKDGKDAKPEIYAYGLRNPWRMSFDMGGEHQLFAGDVGQTMYEEVDIIVKGGNYGWSLREGFHGFSKRTPKRPPEPGETKGARGESFVDPIVAYKNVGGFPGDPLAYGASINGGYVYRGKALPGLSGKYVFADWSRNFGLPQGQMLVATPQPSKSGKWTLEPMDLSSHEGGKLKAFVVGMGQDEDGEIYVLTNDSNAIAGQSGKVWKLVP